MADENKDEGFLSDPFPTECVEEFLAEHSGKLKGEFDFSLASVGLIEQEAENIRQSRLPKASFLQRTLGHVSKEAKLVDGDVVMLANLGFYIGEVIRRNSNSNHRWIAFADWQARFPNLVATWGSKKDLNNSFLLISEKSSSCSPVLRIAKRIHNGPEDALPVYVDSILRTEPE